MNPNDVIVKPVISEKTTDLMSKNKYVFRVPMKANKKMVSAAVKAIFGVQPERVNMIVVRGKTRRIRFQVGRRAAWKKAIVTLKAGEKIEIFESK
ncbi:MAG: 50S ribosomal protein L23 [Spirochaetes bacterium]|nr:50S ribosomal protein L23 [Spirochaetota bacterium]